MADQEHNRLEEWMRLILLNWVMISFVMVYSIAGGAFIGSLLILITGLWVKTADSENALVTLYPELSMGAVVIIAGWILHIFINVFFAMRYDCQSKTYRLRRAALNRHAVFRFAAGGAAIFLAGVGIDVLKGRG